MSRDSLAEAKGAASRAQFLPSKMETAVLAGLGLAVLGVALFFRYAVIQNTPLALGCEAGEESLICPVRLAVLFLFTWNVFGVVAVFAAAIQLWRPNVTAFGIGLVFALLGLVLYNTRLAALAIALLVLSLARSAPEAR
ncbi:MAG: hypothetical protein WD852_11105 [Methyloceanibacter sp.]